MKARVEQFFASIQNAAKDRLLTGVTKTGMVYQRQDDLQGRE